MLRSSMTVYVGNQNNTTLWLEIFSVFVLLLCYDSTAPQMRQRFKIQLGKHLLGAKTQNLVYG